MKTAYLLFGLASACVSGQSSETQYPLCGNDGAPACGNIGQAGRTDKAPATLARESRATRSPLETRTTSTTGASALVAAQANGTATAATNGTATAVGFAGTMFDTTRRMVPVLTRVLVGASSEIQRVSPLHRPLVDHREDVACGNIVSKAPPPRRCRDEQVIVTDAETDETGEVTTSFTP